MSFPTTETGLKEAGYVLDNAAKCRGCFAEIVWYTTPKGKSIPLDEGTLVPHWSTCPSASEFDYNKKRNPKTDLPSSKDDGYRRAK